MFKKFAFAFLILSTLSAALSKTPSVKPKWEKLEGCTLLSEKWRDGDSFHIMHQGNEYIIRLYFVDCPEVEKRFPEYIADQAAYFGCDSQRVMEIGKEASEFTTKTLGGKLFTVYTCWQNAKGTSNLSRFYGIVIINKKNLANLLVKNGLARIYGKRISLPNGKDSKTYREELKALEAKARSAGKGGWQAIPNSIGDHSDLELRKLKKFENACVSPL